MLESDPRLSARRAARRAQLRRRRLTAVGAVALVVVAVLVAIAAAAGGGSKNGSPSSRNVSTPPAPARSPRHSTALVGEDAAGIRNIRRLAQLGLPVYCAGRRGNAVAFTFDDGPGPYTRLALKKLRESGERATFFVVGRSMNNFPGWVRRELPLAAIGDHTYTHPLLPALSPDAVTSQIARTKSQIERDSGQRVTLFRPPYGARNSTVDHAAHSLGLLDIIWTIDSADSLGANWAGIIRNVEHGLHPGAIILMHENRGQTIRALTTLIPELHRRHLRSVSLPELFATDPPSVAQLRRGALGCGVGGRAPSGSS